MKPPSTQLLIDDELLARRLEHLGLGRVGRLRRIVIHQNRTVLVTFTRQGDLRIHRGYAFAPDHVLEAVITFVDPRSRRARAVEAQRELIGFPVERHVPPPGPERRRRDPLPPGDLKLIRTFRSIHKRFNDEYFGGTLEAIRFRISDRMRTRLGELVLDPLTRKPVEIAVSRRHIQRDAWEEVTHTLLHEMVHQWQGETGIPVDHGSTFRRMAVAVGVEPGAKRHIRRRGKAARDG